MFWNILTASCVFASTMSIPDSCFGHQKPFWVRKEQVYLRVVVVFAIQYLEEDIDIGLIMVAMP